jgi:hypothetical protein
MSKPNQISSIVISAVLIGALTMDAKAESGGESPTEIGADIARDLVAEQFASVRKHMSAEMAADLPDSKLAEIWSSLIKQIGRCSGVGEPWSEAKAGFTDVRVPMKFGARTLDLKISVGKNEIVGFFIVPHEERISNWRPPLYADLT